MSRSLLSLLVVPLITFGLVGTAPAQTLVDPFGRDAATMDTEDLALMRQSIETVLRANRTQAKSEWKSAKSDNAGRAVLRKTFTKDGMRCGEVEHVFTAGGGHRYVLPFCEVKGGQWKLAF